MAQYYVDYSKLNPREFREFENTIENISFDGFSINPKSKIGTFTIPDNMKLEEVEIPHLKKITVF